MHELSAAELLGAWERGRGASPGERAVALLAAAGHPAPPGELSVGARDAQLLELRERMFGAAFAAVAECPECREQLDVELTADDVRGAAGPPLAEPLEVEVSGRRLRVRSPTAEDLLAAAATGDLTAGRALVLERCVIDGGGQMLDAHAADLVAARLAEADPGALIDVALACPACGHEWAPAFDIASFLCAELDVCARRLVRDVHALASAYGWSEGDVLAMSAGRRAAYLELAGA